MDFWQDKVDRTQLLDCFENGEDFKTLELKVHPYGLCRMSVLLSWNEEMGMFGGYDAGAGGYRLVGKDLVKQLTKSPRKSQEIPWPDLNLVDDMI